MRPGSQAMALLAVPLNATILEQLLGGPMRLAELHSHPGSAPQSTVRARLRGMQTEGLMVKRDRNGSPGGIVDFSLTAAGNDLFIVLAALQHWLRLAPEGPLLFGSAAGRSAVKSLEDGWSSTIIAALSVEAHSLTELAATISGVSYPSLDRRLSAMRRAGHVRPCPSGNQGTPYELTEWLQQGAAPLAAAVRWERLHAPDTTVSMARLDIETSFLLTLPLLRLALDLTGSWRMGVEINDEEGLLCGALAVISAGRVVSSTAGALSPADSWASGSTPAWAQAMTAGGAGRLEVGGDEPLAGGLLDGLRGALFGAEAKSS